MRADVQRDSGQYANRGEVRCQRACAGRPSDRPPSFHVEAIVKTGVQSCESRVGRGGLEFIGRVRERLLQNGAPRARDARMC